MDKLRELELVVVPITFDTGKSFEDLAGEWSGQGIARPIQLDKWRLWAEEEAKKAKAPSVRIHVFPPTSTLSFFGCSNVLETKQDHEHPNSKAKCAECLKTAPLPLHWTITFPLYSFSFSFLVTNKNEKKTTLQMEKGCFMTIIRKDGKVGGRSNQPLMWEKLIADLEKLPKNDRFGVPWTI